MIFLILKKLSQPDYNKFWLLTANFSVLSLPNPDKWYKHKLCFRETFSNAFSTLQFLAENNIDNSDYSDSRDYSDSGAYIDTIDSYVNC
jgi:hypothetical protein